MRLKTCLCLSAACIVASLTLRAADIQALLNAPVADSEIRLQLSASGKSIQWDIPETRIDFQLLPDGKVFLARDAVKIAYTAFNHLRVKVSATTKRSKAPEATVVGDLMTSILSVLSTVSPNAPGLADLIKTRSSAEKSQLRSKVEPSPCSTLQSDLKDLSDNLYADDFTPKKLTASAKGWADAVDTAFDDPSVGGPAAMKKGSEEIETTLKKLRPFPDKAQKAWDNIKACADVTVTAPQEVAAAADPGQEPEKPKEEVGKPPETVADPGEKASSGDKEKYKKFLADQSAYLKRLQAQFKYLAYEKQLQAFNAYTTYLREKEAAVALQQEKTDALQMLVVQGLILDKLAALKSFITSAENLAKSLDDLATSSNWFDLRSSDYLLLAAEIKPSPDEMETVTVEFTPITYESDPVKNVFTAKAGTTVKVSFDVRWYSRFAPEVGVGAVFGSVTQPEYGTATNAEGKTVVSKVSSKSISVAPTIMVNFVCRCGGSYLIPMVQIGAAASKTAPAIHIGGGFRIPGASGFAIGGGGMFAWVKDLQALSVGQVVSGTAAIEADRGFNSQPTIGGYFTIQYTFGK
jgi:hypothetical protein